MPPPSLESPCWAWPSRIVRWRSFALPLGVTRNPRYFLFPSRIVVRALAPMTVMSDWITRSLLRLTTPAGTLIVSGTSLVASEAAIAARSESHLCSATLHRRRRLCR